MVHTDGPLTQALAPAARREHIWLRYILFSVLFCALSSAYAQTLSLDQALASAEGRTNVINARIELENARVDLERAQADPLITRIPLLQAQQRFETALADFERVYYEALTEIATAYTNLQNAALGLELSQKALDVNQQAVQVSEIRFNNGSITELELQEARTELESARTQAINSRNTLAVAQTNLASILGYDVDSAQLEPVPETRLVSVPVLEAALATSLGHPNILQAQQGFELASASLDTLDPLYASVSQIDDARNQVETAQEGATEAARAYSILVRNLHTLAENAAEVYVDEQDRLSNAVERLETEQQRFDAGLISQFALNQQELTLEQAIFNALQARNNYLVALLELQDASFVPVTGDLLEVRDAGE
ncbi:MAG: TolC family protein [Deinococcota bacterium]